MVAIAALALIGASASRPAARPKARTTSLVVQAFRAANAQAPAALSNAGLQLRIGIARPGGGHTVTAIPLETYVARVLAGEAARDSQPAALEALAITIRTFALANRGRHRADGFDLCDETHCQVMRSATPATERAAAATAGFVLLRGGVPASVYYSASCGGRTELPSKVWPGAENPPFLPSRRDDACGGMPLWTADLAASDLLRALRAGGFRGARLRDVRIASRNASGRVAVLRLDGLTPEKISGQDLRVVVGRTLGWQHIKSTAFDVKRVGTSYRFSGHGSGHGVGLCVIGSVRLAAAGQSAADILNRYYPGLTIGTPAIVAAAATDTRGAARPAPASRASGETTAAASAATAVPEILIALPDGDEGERGVIADLASRASVELSRTLGLPPPRIVLRFHPTIDTYEDATGQPWFTSGAMVNGEAHFPPLTVLRDRGVLERTVRHELVHVMTDQTMAGRPLWVREGAAMYFAGEPAIPGEPRAGAEARRPIPPCPAEAELRRPVSAGALTNAYARAQSCFTRQIEQGKSWRDVR